MHVCSEAGEGGNDGENAQLHSHAGFSWSLTLLWRGCVPPEGAQHGTGSLSTGGITCDSQAQNARGAAGLGDVRGAWSAEALEAGPQDLCLKSR